MNSREYWRKIRSQEAVFFGVIGWVTLYHHKTAFFSCFDMLESLGFPSFVRRFKGATPIGN